MTGKTLELLPCHQRNFFLCRQVYISTEPGRQIELNQFPPGPGYLIMWTQVSVFVVLASLLFLGQASLALHELRGPVYVQEMIQCLPDDMYQLITLTLDSMKDFSPEQPPGTDQPVDKLAWYAQLMIHYIKGGRSFCESYALTTSLATAHFSNHVLRGASQASYESDCRAHLRQSSNAYVRQTGQAIRPGPGTVSNDPLVKCLTTGSQVAEQTRLVQKIQPEK